MNDLFLYDKAFLKALDQQKQKLLFIRITSLDINDIPRETIEGTATGGSINIDGASAVRRSCSLSLLGLDKNQEITEPYWALKNKFKLEVGLENNINPKYDKIIWFKQGIYIINSFSTNRNTNSFNISISGQDKMCRLNGTINGKLTSSVDFGTEDYYDTKTQTLISYKIPLYTIIKNAIKVYGQEKDENIIINDLDENGWELWDYIGDQPMYMFYRLASGNDSYGQVLNITFNENFEINWQGSSMPIKEAESVGFKYYSLNSLDPNYNNDCSRISLFTENYYDTAIIKITKDQTVGYHKIDLVYNTDLILKAGETVESMLSKIRDMLGNFEYFYDLDGRFVFQKKQNYLQELFSPINGDIVEPTMITTPYAYEFDDLSLFTSIANNPNINSINNDFVVWGSRKNESGTELPFHARYAIDKKPTIFINYIGTKFTTEQYDWRELIYQMAIDYYKNNKEKDYLYQLKSQNPSFIDGITGYEQYYTDLQGFWRQLYNIDIDETGAAADPELKDYEYYTDGEYKYWNKLIHKDATMLNFWFDFLDTGDTEIAKYENRKIGNRTLVEPDSKTTSIYFNSTPEVQFVVAGVEEAETEETSYTPIFIQDYMLNLFQRSTQGNSAIEKINELINNHTIFTEGVSITSIPIYYLKPNTRIYIKDEGDFTIDKITYSLNYNGTMNMSCTKILNQIY